MRLTFCEDLTMNVPPTQTDAKKRLPKEPFLIIRLVELNSRRIKSRQVTHGLTQIQHLHDLLTERRCTQQLNLDA